MSLDGTYDPDNIFAKILRGEAPCARVFEDDHVLSFMDVFPQTKGHTLVIPKHSTARNLLEEDPQILSPLILGVQRIARAVRAALEPIAPLLQLAAAMEAKQGGVHYRTLAAIGGCRVYEGRRINGKVCPKEPKEKAKRPPPPPEPPEPEPEPEPKEPQRKKYHGRDW